MPHNALKANCHAVIPAAGLSRRMGVPKLLLDVAGKPVVTRLIEALQTGGVDSVNILVREEDAPLRELLADLPVTVALAPDATPDMRRSVELLLAQIQQDRQPQPSDAWLLCPADHPVLVADVIARILAARVAHPASILVPVHDHQRGHPTLFPWSTAAAVKSIPAGQGINRLLRDGLVPVIEVTVDNRSILLDLDTPEDYQRLLEESDGAAAI